MERMHSEVADGQPAGAPEHPAHARVVAPPPLVYVAPLLVGIVLHVAWEPFNFFPETWMGHAAGWPLIASALLLVAWAVRTMARAGESPDAYKPTGRIVSGGPFGYSRNPMYLAITLVYVGIALAVNTVWPVALLPAALVFIHYGVIFREEKYLEGLFGGEYLDYRAKVRRWI